MRATNSFTRTGKKSKKNNNNSSSSITEAEHQAWKPTVLTHAFSDLPVAGCKPEYNLA